MQHQTDTIRRSYDPKEGVWHFSVVDVLGAFVETSDPRNYWKVLKNRLKKSDNELVTHCNQLKLVSSDGKAYLTDVADKVTMGEILTLISSSSREQFEGWYRTMVAQNASTGTVQSHSFSDELSTEERAEKEKEVATLAVEVIEEQDTVMVQALVGGVSPNNIVISIGYNHITIKGNRPADQSIPLSSYLTQELFWGAFERTISFSSLLDIENAESILNHGLLMVKVKKINKDRTRDLRPRLIS